MPFNGSLSKENFDRSDLPVSPRIPIYMYQMLLRKIPGVQGHHIYTGHFYTNYFLAQQLVKLKSNLTGIITNKPKRIAPEIKKKQNFEPNSQSCIDRDFSFRMEGQENCHLFDYKGSHGNDDSQKNSTRWFGFNE